MPNDIPKQNPESTANKFLYQTAEAILRVILIAIGGAVIANFTQISSMHQQMTSNSEDHKRLEQDLSNRTEERYTKSDAANDFREIRDEIQKQRQDMLDRTKDRILRSESEKHHDLQRASTEKLRKRVDALSVQAAKMQGSNDLHKLIDKLLQRVTKLEEQIARKKDQ